MTLIFVIINKNIMRYKENIISSAKQNTIEICNNFHTRQLLSELNCVRAYMGAMEFTFIDAIPIDNNDWVLLNNYKKILKSVLSTREHIPNKKESKKIRQEKAKRK
jgi:hypothetical protein